MDQVETAKYKITGLVDIFDEQGNITGTFPIGSVQELPVEVGMKAVEAGTAEAVGEEEIGEEVAPEEEVAETVPEEETVEADAPTGETGEEVEEEDEDEVI